MKDGLLYSELTYKVIGAGMKVHTALGHGFLEKVYENALMVMLRKSGIMVEQQVPVKVHFEGVVVGDYYADILVENKLIIELKAAESINKVHKAQTLNYLKATGLDIALIFSFGAPSFEHFRLINRLEKPIRSELPQAPGSIDS